MQLGKFTAATLRVKPRQERVVLSIDWSDGSAVIYKVNRNDWGTMTGRQFHGHESVYVISDKDKARALRAFLKAEIAPFVERVRAGYTRHWDGSNHVARFDYDATIARQYIACRMDTRRETLEYS